VQVSTNCTAADPPPAVADCHDDASAASLGVYDSERQHAAAVVTALARQVEP